MSNSVIQHYKSQYIYRQATQLISAHFVSQPTLFLFLSLLLTQHHLMQACVHTYMEFYCSYANCVPSNMEILDNYLISSLFSVEFQFSHTQPLSKMGNIIISSSFIQLFFNFFPNKDSPKFHNETNFKFKLKCFRITLRIVGYTTYTHIVYSMYSQSCISLWGRDGAELLIA